jgi:hypothetical protein
MTLSLWESRTPAEELAEHFAQIIYKSMQKQPSPAIAASEHPASRTMKWMRRCNPHDYTE